MTETVAEPDALPNGWRGVLAPLDIRSGDGRILATPPGGQLRLRQPPLTLLYAPALSDGHDGAVLAGRIDRAWIADGKVMGEGPFDLDSEGGREAARQLAGGMANGISIDPDDVVVEWRWLDVEGNEVDVERMLDEARDAAEAAGDEIEGFLPELPEGTTEVMTDWRLMGATLTPQPAFDQARVQPVYDYSPAPDALVVASEEEHQAGGMIALRPADPDALAVETGEPPDQLHVTVAFLGGDAAALCDVTRDAVHTAAVRAADVLGGPFAATVAGYGVLGDEDPPATVLFLNGGPLSTAHNTVMSTLAEAPDIPEQHAPFLAHMTLGYGIPLEAAVEYAGRTIMLDRVSVDLGRDRTDYPIGPTEDENESPEEDQIMASALTADRGGAVSLVAGGGPIEPSAKWFDDPHLTGRTPLTITEDGQVRGHVATWLDDDGNPNCHIGYPDVCVTPPHSSTGYREFHTAPVRVTEGHDVYTGRLTYDIGHANPRASTQAALAHYDNTGTAIADIRCGEDEHGIWAAGALRPDIDDASMRKLRASPPSGDWRARPDFRPSRYGEGLELVAVLAVNVPGFRPPRALAASAGDRQVSLIGRGMPIRWEALTAAGTVVLPGPQEFARLVAGELRASAARDERALVLARRIGRDPASRARQLAARIGR